MFAFTQTYTRTAMRLAPDADDLARPISDPAALAWLCPSCGKLHVFEGGRPGGKGEWDECPDCGCRLAADHAAAEYGPAREPVRSAMDRYLL